MTAEEFLTSCIGDDKRYRLMLGDPKTSQHWYEEHDVMGYIGRTTGTLKILLLIPTKRSSGGPAILTQNVLRVIEVRTKKVVWTHPNFKPPILSVSWRPEKALPWAVSEGLAGNKIAFFDSERQALHYVAFMKGERMRVS
jgi:hypothetical protein